MSTKPNPLKAAMMAVQHPANANVPAPSPLRVVRHAPAAYTAKPASRIGKKVISGHFDPAVAKQLRALANERDSSVQEMLREALNDLFLKHNKSRIA